MPVSRNPNQEYSSEYLADVQPFNPPIQIRDADGDIVDVDGDNPIPTELDAYITEDIRSSLDVMIDEQRKTNEYLSILTGVTL